MNANNDSGSIGDSLSGTNLSCVDYQAGDFGGMALVGFHEVFDTTLGDILISQGFVCE